MKTLFLLAFIALAVLLPAQPQPNEIGYYFDIDGKLIYHYLSPNYSAKNVLYWKLDPSRKALPACVYRDNKEDCGLIKLRRNTHKLLFYPEGKKVKLKLSKKELQAYQLFQEDYTINLDFNVQARKTLKAFGPWTIRYGYRGIGIEYYVRNQKDEQEFVFEAPFIGNQEFRDDFKRLDRAFPVVNAIVEAQQLKFEDFESIVDLMQWEFQYTHQITLDYDANFKKVDSAGIYQMKVDSIQKNQFLLSYWRPDGSIAKTRAFLFEGINKHSHPVVTYNRTGKPVKEISYEKGKVDTIRTFHHNGELFEVLTLAPARAKLTAVFDAKGKAVLDQDGNGSLSHYDWINERTITNEYENYHLKGAFYINENGDRVFLFTESPVRYKFFEQLAIKVEKELDDIEFHASDRDLQFGYLLFDCTVNEKGKAIDLSIKHPLNPGFDEKVLAVMNKYLAQSKEFLAAEYEGEEVKQQIILPLYMNVYSKGNLHQGHWTDALLPSNGNYVSPLRMNPYVPIGF